MASYTDEIWKMDNTDFPVRIYREWRSNNRISFGKKHIILRLATISTSFGQEEYRHWAENWLINQIRKNSHLKSKYSTAKFTDGYIVPTIYKDYKLHFIIEQRKINVARLMDKNKIDIRLSNELSSFHQNDMITTLVSRVIAKDLRLIITRRIHYLNEIHFNQKIHNIRIKNNNTNWGSCSSSGNINISFRTLLTPVRVQDYIFIHELAHLIELNHNRDFWRLVESAMPEYKQMERWLRTEGKVCQL